jgi:phosphate-selective porin OprO/OprP
MIAATSLCGSWTLAEEANQTSAYDSVWSKVSLFNDKEAAVLQKFALTGRLQGDAYSFKDDNNNELEDFVWRRFRFGFKATVFKDVTIHSEMDLDMNEADSGQWDDFYSRLTDSYVEWTPCEGTELKVGKQSAGFTLDGATSSKMLIVPERSIVSENLWFPTEYFTGASASGELNGWSYNVGGFSASGEPEFGHFNSGYFGLLSAGHKVGEKGILRLDYVYNDPEDDPDYGYGTKKLEHIVALVHKQQLGEKSGVWADVAYGAGHSDFTQGDLLGIDIMPFYNISESFQLVMQYAGVFDLDNMSDVTMARYASRNVDKTKVETAHNLLLGFNWYLYGHKLKWQNAIEYNYGEKLATSGEDYNGYGITSALRISW